MELTALKGIGSKTNEYFKKLGVYTQEELLEFFPATMNSFFCHCREIGYKTFAAKCLYRIFFSRVRKKTITTGLSG